MSVMFAVRGQLIAHGKAGHGKPDQKDPGPPAFLRRRAQAALHRQLTELFEPHADELAVPPETAALALRSLIFGSARAEFGMGPSLTPDQIADLRARRHPEEGHALMLLRLIRTYLAPYRRWLTVVVALQFAATVAMLFLPSLNADIIDNGVAQGDTGYIVRIGGVMLLVSLVQIACSIVAVWFGSRTAMAAGRDLRADLFQRVGSFSGQGDGALRRPVADHPRHQRRAAGADARADDHARWARRSRS